MLDPVNTAKAKEKGANRWCSDNLILATHIIYVAPPFVEDNQYELDYMTYSFLKEETKKYDSDKKILVLSFPYSSRDIPVVLMNCDKFELMNDFSSFVNIFQLSCNSNYQNNINYVELSEKIKIASAETEKFAATPKILVTEQTENVDSAEIDVLL